MSVITPFDEDPESAEAIKFRKNLEQRVGPQAVLPSHLQNVSFVEDIWTRVKADPIGSPVTKKMLNEDPQIRGIIQSVLLAAHMREDEIFRHNQSRVFAEVLGRVADNFGKFINTPLAPVGLIAVAKSNSQPVVIEELPEDATEPAEQEGDQKLSAAKTWVAKFLVGFLTPKLFLAGITALFAVTSGLSWLKIENYKQARDSFKDAAAAAKTQAVELKATQSTLESQIEARDDSIEELRISLTNQKAKTIERDQSLIKSKAKISKFESRVKNLTEELGTKRGEESETVKAETSLRESAEAKLRDQVAALKQAKEESLRLTKAQGELRKQISDLSDLLGREQAKTSQISTRNGQLLIQNGKLKNIKVAKSFADDAFSQIKGILPYAYNRSATEKQIHAFIIACEQNQEVLLRPQGN